MKISILGAGAVGCYYGARLALAGNDVQFIVRPGVKPASSLTDIRITSALGDIHLPSVRTVSEGQQLDPPELIVVAVKLWDTETAIRSIAPIVTNETSVISLQNGVEKDEEIAAILRSDCLLGAVTYIIVNKREDGTIVHSGTLQRIIVGEFDGTISQRVRRIVSTLSQSGIDASLSTDIRRETWEKFVFLASVSGMTASTRETIGSIRSDIRTRTQLEQAMREAATLARAEGVGIRDDFVDEKMRFIDTLPAEGRSSMANDLMRGSRLELEWLSGAVVRRAQKHDIAVPVHTSLYHALL